MEKISYFDTTALSNCFCNKHHYNNSIIFRWATKTHYQCIALLSAVEAEAVIISGSPNDILRAGIQDIVLTFCNRSNFHLTRPTIPSHLRTRSVKNDKTLNEPTNLINFNGQLIISEISSSSLASLSFTRLRRI